MRDRYRLHEVIGQGGRGSVYRARDESLGRWVAVKIFDLNATSEADLVVQENEVNVLASLNHHSVVGLLDAGVDRSDPERPRIYLVMELVEGTDLKIRLEHGALSTRQIAQIGYDLAEGLHYIHQRGIIHRDIKPANILLVDYSNDGARERAKLTDFGIALVSGAEPRLSSGVTTGTAAYLSPEQAMGGTLDSASDVYSLGLVLLECFTGRIAFPGQPVPAAMARLTADPEIPENLDPTWRALLSAMTNRDPAGRPPIAELVLALHQAIVAEAGRHRHQGHPTTAEYESARMTAVRRYHLFDTPPDGAFDRITAMAARVFSVPMALVSIVDTDRIWFKSHHGLDRDQIDRDPGLCASAILDNVPWVVHDARVDPRTMANPLVAGDLGLQFYAGVPLQTEDGYNLGTICVMDYEPRTTTDDDIATLQDLAALVMSELELRLQSRRFPPPVPSGRRTNSSVPSDPHLPTAAANAEIEGSATITQAPLPDRAKDAV